MNEIIEERLKQYNLKTASDEQNALKEIAQEVILYALSKTSFFGKASFLGGTALRIVHGLNRFSEDLDFATNKVDKSFQFDDYIDEVLSTLKDYGLSMSVKKSNDDNFVKSRALKEDSEKWKISFPSNRRLKSVMIKMEIDTNPPVGFHDTHANLDFPILHQIRIGDLDSLFAGKIHALLCRKYVKGRDWYDFLWYVRQKSLINYEFLKNALKQMGPYVDKDINHVDRNFVVEELSKKIESLDWRQVAIDVERFLRLDEISSLKLWSENLFMRKVQQISIE